MHDMRTVLAASLAVLMAACQPANAPTPIAETPGIKAPPAPAQAAAAPVVLAGVDLSQPLRAVGTEPFWSVEIRPDGLV